MVAMRLPTHHACHAPMWHQGVNEVVDGGCQSIASLRGLRAGCKYQAVSIMLQVEYLSHTRSSAGVDVAPCSWVNWNPGVDLGWVIEVVCCA